MAGIWRHSRRFLKIATRAIAMVLLPLPFGSQSLFEIGVGALAYFAE